MITVRYRPATVVASEVELMVRSKEGLVVRAVTVNGDRLSWDRGRDGRPHPSSQRGRDHLPGRRLFGAIAVRDESSLPQRTRELRLFREHGLRVPADEKAAALACVAGD